MHVVMWAGCKKPFIAALRDGLAGLLIWTALTLLFYFMTAPDCTI